MPNYLKIITLFKHLHTNLTSIQCTEESLITLLNNLHNSAKGYFQIIILIIWCERFITRNSVSTSRNLCILPHCNTWFKFPNTFFVFLLLSHLFVSNYWKLPPWRPKHVTNEWHLKKCNLYSTPLIKKAVQIQGMHNEFTC